MMTSAQVVESSVTITNNSPSQDYTHLDDQMTLLNVKLTATFHLTLMMTSAQVVESSVTITNNSPSQDYTHLDDQMTLLTVKL